MRIVAAESTDLFVGTEDHPLQVVTVGLEAAETAAGPCQVSVRGDGLVCERPATISALPPGAGRTVELGVSIDARSAPGTVIAAEVVAQTGGSTEVRPVEVVVAEPGWTMFMVSHFHYDPVWWNTQAAYTEAWGTRLQTRAAFQEPGLALVKGHLEMARRDPDYCFVLAELDYLKPYWDAYPADREYIRHLLAEGRLELMGGTYNEPNTNLTSAESTIRNAIYGVGYQRDVLGGTPRTAWQLDAFGHDPLFPAIMADAGLTSSSWARGPFHEWGPNWQRGPNRIRPRQTHRGEAPRMQFASEFEWLSPSGGGLLTSFMPNHYSAGWWMDAAATLEEAEQECYRHFKDLQAVAATKNVMLPVGTDYSPPNKWVTAIHRDWNERYVWPRFITGTPHRFFEAVRAERAARGRGFSPQTRDMNPVYTGKDVSFIDTKQAQRIAENTLLSAEKFATVASLLGARFPSEAIDKAWRQLLFGAHHDGITGSESDQVYLDLLGGWREAVELGSATLDGALRHLTARIDTSGDDGWALTVFNPLSWPRTDVVHAVIEVPGPGITGVELRDDAGAVMPMLVDMVERGKDGSLERVGATFIAADVPALGYRTYRVVPAEALPEAGWREVPGTTIENGGYTVTVDPARGGAVASVVERRTGKELLRPGGLGDALLAYGEYPNHPQFAEGPWHLTPDGSRRSAAEAPATVAVEESPIGRRIRVTAPFEGCRVEREVVLWDGVDRVEFATGLHGFAGQDTLFRVRFDAAVEGGAAVAEVGNAVVGRGFGFPNADVAEVPYTLDDPSYDWFALGATARVDLVEPGSDGAPGEPRASRAISVAEVIVPGDPAQDDAVRDLVIALVRQGVTATLSRHDGSRYGTLDIDSNLPDVRLCVGGPDENGFVADVLESAGPAYRAELDRQLTSRGRARVWVPAAKPMAETWLPNADLRGARQLPVLIVAGVDADATIAAIAALVDDLSDSVIAVAQPAGLDGTTGRVEDYTVALLNRGMPGSNVEIDGSLYLSLMRSCSGWPSGVWIDPPRRTMPDGSNFQFQHWSHTFEYALVGGPGDWRAARAVRAGHEYNHPLIARSVESHRGDLPAAMSFVSIEPESAVVTAVKPHGNPMARMAGTDADPARGVAFRVYESSGRPTRARLRFFVPLGEPFATNLLEEARESLDGTQDGGGLAFDLEPCATTTVVGVPDVGAITGRSDSSADRGGRDELAPRTEPAQPVFTDYWLHNKGPAPMGYQPLSVQIAPGRLAGRGPFTVPITVASERTDRAVAGSVTLALPPGWQATPDERLFRLEPGAHAAFEASVTSVAGTPSGRYFVAARVVDDAGQVIEDVVTVDHDPTADEDPVPDLDERSPELTAAIQRAMRRAGFPAEETPPPEAGGELEVTLGTGSLRVRAGERGELSVTLRNRAASEIRGEAQLISPHETWPITSPWTQGFAVGPGRESSVTFAVHPPADHRGGEYWALVKVMYFGRIHYTEAIGIVLDPVALPAGELAVLGARSPIP